MNQLLLHVMALLPSVSIAMVAVLGMLSAIDKALETIAGVLTGKPQAAVKNADSYLESAIGVLQTIVDWLAPRSGKQNPPAK